MLKKAKYWGYTLTETKAWYLVYKEFTPEALSFRCSELAQEVKNYFLNTQPQMSVGLVEEFRQHPLTREAKLATLYLQLTGQQ